MAYKGYKYTLQDIAKHLNLSPNYLCDIVKTQETRESRIEIKRGHERILYVDDEPALKKLGEIFLSSIGYQVTSFSSPTEALKTFKESPESFDILIADQTMPELPGSSLAQQIKVLRPDFPVIICTGYSDTMDENKARELGFNALLMKPFEKDVLSNKLREIFDG